MNCPNCQATHPETAKFCSNCGTRLEPVAAPEGERKLVTVLFADVVGSTAMADQLDPEEITEIMNGAFAFMNSAVARQQGMVSRLLGDAILAFFGLPVAHENEPERAIRAGLQIQQAAEKFAGRIERRYGIEFRVRVGIHTGLAVVDLIGNQVKSEYTAMGDTVNVASRLQNAAPPGGILITHATYRHVRGLFVAQPLEPLQVKGKSEPLQVYQVLEARARAFRQPTRGVAGIETPMVGREAELRQMQASLNALIEAGQVRARLVTITGEAGVGKSRLLYEFTNWLDLQPDSPRIFRARSTEEMIHLPYALLRDLFATEFGIQDSDSEAVAKEKLEQGIAEVASPVQGDWAPFIGYMIGFHYAGSSSLEGILGDAQQIRDRAFFAAAQFFTAVMKDQPVVILLEDIHWADEGSLDFMEYLVQSCLEYPLMVVGLARSTHFERRPSWGEGQAVYNRIDLTLLSETDSQKLVAEILRKVPDIPPALHNLIVRQAEGNPFYVEEVIKMLIDDGVIVPGPDRWQITMDPSVKGKIPPTLTGVLQARLDGLPSQERRALHRASVAGRVFWDDLTARMQEAGGLEEKDPVVETNEALVNLQGRELIFQRDQSAFTGTTEYIFKHAVLQEVTYERLLKRLRRTYHFQVAEWLCDHGGERVEEFAGRIAEHYERGGELGRAAAWYARAGKQAQDTYAPDLAVNFYQKALALWDQQDDKINEHHPLQQIEVFQGLGQVLHWLGRYSEAVEMFQNMAGAAEARGETVMQARAWNGMAEALMQRGDTRAAIESAAREEAFARAAEAPLELSKALWLQAWGALRLGERETALSLAEEVSALSHRLQDRDQMAHSLNLLGVLASMSGRFQEAAGYFDQALAIFRALGNRRRAIPLMNNLGVIAEARGDYQEARARYQEALDTAREIGNRDGEMVYLSNLGGAKVRLEQFSSAEADLRQVIHMAGSGGQDVLSSTYNFLAEAYLGQNQAAKALASAQYALKLAEQMGSQDDLGVVWRTLGRVALSLQADIPVETAGEEQPRPMGAEACFLESERIFKEVEREEEHARTLRERAKYYLAVGDHINGKRLWEEARAIFIRLGALPEVERMENVNAT